ncbi:GGDEF domain-containing protein [Plantactinospora sp. GCM10030261]|uniref:GGDEF domain-containing protein n=1 Tax=Plantactinospora sp. GCM10030261 TaxID=3273420 RepID=UPI00361CF636
MNGHPLTMAAVGLAAAGGYLTARYRMRGQLVAAQRAATIDPLTGIANRAGLSAAADAILNAGQPVVVALVDLVGFKAVNDTHGHDAGDHILTTTAHRLTTMAGPRGIAARLGGDEFALLTRSSGPLDGLLLRLHTALTTPVTYQGHPLAVGATVGAVPAHAGQPLEVWLHRADLAMYTARAHRAATHIWADTTTPATDTRPIQRARELARPTSRLTTAWRAA